MPPIQEGSGKKPHKFRREYEAFKLSNPTNKPFSSIRFIKSDLRSAYIIGELEEDFKDAAQRITKKKVLIDVSQVKILPTAFFGLLLQLATDLKQQDREVRIAGINESSRRVFDMIDVNHIVRVFDTLKEAVEEQWECDKHWYDIFKPSKNTKKQAPKSSDNSSRKKKKGLNIKGL